MVNFSVIWCTLVIFAISVENGLATYKVAAYEHSPVKEEGVEETIMKNLEIYRRRVENAVDMGADIIVFPEYGLTTVDADPEDYAIHITIASKVIRELHDMANEHGMYIVVNLLEKNVSSNSNVSYYNTDLVFDRKGTIIAKYRKINLSAREKDKKLTAGNESITFKTEFGVTFGLLNSDDILFEEPTRTILSNSKITNVIYPTAWKSHMPLQNSLSFQSGYAVKNNVNVLAAGYYYPEDGYGSDIFPIYGYSTPEVKYASNGRLLVMDLVKKTHRKSTDRVKRYSATSAFFQNETEDAVPNRRFPVDKYKFKQIDFNQTWIKEHICYGDFCCTFDLMVSKSSATDIYKLMIYDGVDELGDAKAHARYCELLACSTHSSDTCGTPNKSNTTFSQIKISSSFANNKTIYIPIIRLTQNLRSVNGYSYHEHNFTHVLKIDISQNNLLVFGIIGRVNDNNISQNIKTNSGASGQSSNQLYYFIPLLLFLFFINDGHIIM